MDDDERALLQAVLDAPDDDTPRLVYADWLQGRSDPAACARGELIALQCALARTEENDSPERIAMIRREADLLLLHHDDWVDAIVPDPLPRRRNTERLIAPDVLWLFERGFISDYEVRSAHFQPPAEDLEDLLTCVPLTSVHLHLDNDSYANRDRIEELLDTRGLERIRTLTLDLDDWVTRSRLPAPLLSDRFGAVTDLRLGWDDCAHAGHPPISDLLAAPIGTYLTRLCLDWPQDRDPEWDGIGTLGDVLEDIARSPLRERIESLVLRTNFTLGARGVSMLCEHAWPALRRLVIGSTDVAMLPAALAHAVTLPALRSIGLEQTGISPIPWDGSELLAMVRAIRPIGLALQGPQSFEPIAAVLRVPELAELHTLELRGYGLEAAQGVAAASHLRNLRVLDLSEANPSAEALAAIAGAPHLTTLRTLDLSHSCGELEHVGPLCDAPYLDGLRRLDLRGHAFADFRQLGALQTRFGGAVLECHSHQPDVKRYWGSGERAQIRG